MISEEQIRSIVREELIRKEKIDSTFDLFYKIKELKTGIMNSPMKEQSDYYNSVINTCNTNMAMIVKRMKDLGVGKGFAY